MLDKFLKLSKIGFFVKCFRVDVLQIYRETAKMASWHYVKSVHIRSISGPYFSLLGLNTEIYRESPSYLILMHKNTN